MPISYTFDERIIIVRMVGQYSVQDVEDALLLALTDPARPQGAVLLLDVRASESLRTRPPEDIWALGRLLARWRMWFGSRVAGVAPTDLLFGLMRMGQVPAEAGGVIACVFRAIEPARAWLLAGDDAPEATRCAALHPPIAEIRLASVERAAPARIATALVTGDALVSASPAAPE
ncbi:MAG: hypothetical protein ACJ79S_13155 [Gemmatimonadaceae bacterium]